MTDEPTCASCGVPFIEHLGLQGMCRELQEANEQIQSLESHERLYRCELADAQRERHNLAATLEKVKDQRNEQITYSMHVHAEMRKAIMETLERHNAVPEGITPEGHPIEQVVGTCLAVLVGELAEKQERLDTTAHELNEARAALRVALGEQPGEAD